MYFTTNNETQLDNYIQQNETKIKSLSIHLENLNREIDTFFSELQMNLDQLSRYMSNQDNFTEENWGELMNQKKIMEDKLQRELDNIRNPIKAKSSQSSTQHVQRHWLFVR